MDCNLGIRLRGGKKRGGLKALLPLSALFLALWNPACAQNRAKIAIDLGKPVNVLTDISLGLPVVTSDENSINEAGIPYLRAAGVTSVRYPGNHGLPDLYH
jgi:hypothetical protein